MKNGGLTAITVVIVTALFTIFNTTNYRPEERLKHIMTIPGTDQAGNVGEVIIPGPGPEIVETPEPVEETTKVEEPEPVLPAYELTAEERDLVERVVMAEAGNEEYEGQMAVAQCILNASRLTGTRPTQVVIDYRYTHKRPEPTEEVKAAVSAVFDEGQTVLDEDVLWFYAPDLVTSTWHESKTYAHTIGGHRFFKEAN